MTVQDDDRQDVDSTDKNPDVHLLLQEIRHIRTELYNIKISPLLKTYESIPKVLFLQFLKGIFLGLGSFLGATIVVSLVIYLLSNIAFIPIIGDLVKSILLEIKQ